MKTQTINFPKLNVYLKEKTQIFKSQDKNQGNARKKKHQ